MDGRLKVTGGARYAAEFQVEDVTYGVARHEHRRQGARHEDRHAAAEKAPGVLAVITHRKRRA